MSEANRLKSYSVLTFKNSSSAPITTCYQCNGRERNRFLIDDGLQFPETNSETRWKTMKLKLGGNNNRKILSLYKYLSKTTIGN